METVVMMPDRSTSASDFKTMLFGIRLRPRGERRHALITSTVVNNDADIHPIQMFLVSLRSFPFRWKKTKAGTERFAKTSNQVTRL